MSARYYFDSAAGPACSPSYGGTGWTATGQALRRRLNVTRQASAMATTPNITGPGAGGSAFVLARQFVLPGLAAQVLQGTIKGQVRCMESASGLNATLAVAVAVCAADGSNKRALLTASAGSPDSVAAMPPELSNAALTNRRMRDPAEATPVTLVPQAVQAGDCLVVEVGYREQGNTASGRVAWFRFGDAAASDLPENDTATADDAPWIEFSQDVLLLGQGGPVTVVIVSDDGQTASLPDGYTYGGQAAQASPSASTSPSASVSASPSPSPAPPPADHTYFDTLVARPDCVLSYALRSQVQLTAYRHSTARPPWMVYDPEMDAAQVRIPCIDPDFPYASLAQPVGTQDTELQLASWHSNLIRWRLVRVGGEAMLISAINAAAMRLTVERGWGQSVSAAHGAGAQVYIGTNSLMNQVRLPANLAPGSTHLVTWDVRWSDSYRNVGSWEHKAFQVSTSDDALMLEVQVRYGPGTHAPGFNGATDVGSVTLRGYGVTPLDPVPYLATFLVRPDRWTRFWLLIDGVSGLDEVSLWVADEARDPVQLYDKALRDLWLPAAKFWQEWNTSTDTHVRGDDLRDLVSWSRNVAILRDVPVADIPALLMRPEADA